VLTRAPDRPDGLAGDETMFTRVICGVDDSPHARAAVRAAVALLPQGGSLELVSVASTHAGEAGAADRGRARLALMRAAAEAGAAARSATVRSGRPVDTLLHELETRAATLAVVGSRGRSRAVGVALGSVATFLLHEAPCPVLVARADVRSGWAPATIAVGVDGSPASAHAFAVARRLGERFGAVVRPVCATRDVKADLQRAREIAPDTEEWRTGPIEALAHASEAADLVIVGSRCLRGVRALQSVSERVAHDAHCPVLVLRDAPV
jgi:nucleotide-binding universal stress UspA family protein